MFRKILSIIIAILMVTTVFLVKKYNSFDAQIQEYYNSVTASVNNVLLYDVSNDKILFSKNADAQISMGSVTKLVTALTAFEVLSPKDICIVGIEVELYTTTDASLSMIRKGQSLSFEKLLYALLLPSGCDAAYTIAVNCARKATNNKNLPSDEAVKYFTKMMDEYTAGIGCKNSAFVNPDGQDAEGQHMTLEDVLLIAKKVSENELLMKITGTQYIKTEISSRTGRYRDSEVYEWSNTNKLLDKNSDYYYEYAKGLKTGYTLDAGFALVACAENNNKKVICILSKCRTGSARFTVAKKLCQLSLADAEIN